MENQGDYFSLKWSNFRSSLTEGFHDFLQEEAMVDVTLAAEGKFVQAHKLVLSVCSPYFKNLFKVNPCKHPIVFLKDVHLNDLSYMLEFMYKGEVGVKHEDLQSFLKLAETLKVKGLAGKKFQSNEHCTSSNLDSNIARVRKKLSKDAVYDVNEVNSEFMLRNEDGEKKVLKTKKKRFPCKSKPVMKKFKSEKCDDDSVNKCEEKNSDNVSEDEDNDPLVKFADDDDVKSGCSSKQSIPQFDNKSESQCDNKTGFGGWSDDVPDSDDSGGPDVNSFFQSDYSEEAEQTPQDNYNGLNLLCQARRANPVWDYFQLDGDKAVCKLCHKRLAYKNHMYLTSLSNHLASKRHGHHEHYLEYVSKKNELVKETDIFNNLFFRIGKRMSSPGDLSIIRHHLQ